MRKNYSNMVLTVLRNRDVRIFSWCLGVIAIWRVCLELINQAIVPVMHSPIWSQMSANFTPGLLRWIIYDAGWYLEIIRNGYLITHNLHGQETVAFFPLFPFLDRYLSDLLGTPVVRTGIVMNLVLLCFAAFFLYKLTELIALRAGRKNGQLLARIAVLLLLLNPASFFFASLYGDALLVFATTAAFYFGFRKQFIWAAVFAGIASGCKSTGMVVLPALFVIYVQTYWGDIKKPKVVLKQHVPKLIAMCLLGLSGLLVYMTYLWHRFDDPLLFVRIEKYWQRSPSLLAAAHGIWGDYVGLFTTSGLFTNTELYSIYLCAIPVVLGVFTLYLLIRHRFEYLWLALFISLVVLMPMSTGELASINRYILVLTPAMSYAAVYFYPNKYTRPLLIAFMCLLAILLFIFSASFLAGFFMG